MCVTAALSLYLRVSLSLSVYHSLSLSLFLLNLLFMRVCPHAHHAQVFGEVAAAERRHEVSTLCNLKVLVEEDETCNSCCVGICVTDTNMT